MGVMGGCLSPDCSTKPSQAGHSKPYYGSSDYSKPVNKTFVVFIFSSWAVVIQHERKTVPSVATLLRSCLETTSVFGGPSLRHVI